MAHIITIGNQKGGCGKTTTAVNLSAGLAVLGKRVLLIDMDPQGNSSLTFGINIEDLHISMSDILLDDNVHFKYNIFSKGNIHIAPSNPTLNYAEERLHTMEGKATRLKEKIGEVESNYDFILIDCPPSIGILTTNALMASHWTILPVDVGFYSLVGIKQYLARIEDVMEQNKNLKILGILVTMYNERNNISREVMAKLKGSFKDKVFNTAIRRDIKLTEAPGHLQTAIEYMWRGRGSSDYLALSNEVLKRV